MIAAVDIASALGDARREGRGWRCRCPIHGGCSLVVSDGRGRLLVKCWGGGCDARDILAALSHLRLVSRDQHGATASTDDRADCRRERDRRTKIARRIWHAAKDARGSPVVHYLASRGITIDPPPSLRWAPALRRLDGTDGPAMVARIDSIDGELIGIARTWLTRDGAGKWCRLGRAMLGRAAGGAVQLASGTEIMLIGEGIETTLAGIEVTGLPGWAALSTAGIVALALPRAVRNIVILADHDANGAGERAARIAQTHWRQEGRRVSVWMSPQPGADTNDCLLAALGTEGRNVAG
jgi:putative DNA primase/helicase